MNGTCQRATQSPDPVQDRAKASPEATFRFAFRRIDLHPCEMTLLTHDFCAMTVCIVVMFYTSRVPERRKHLLRTPQTDNPVYGDIAFWTEKLFAWLRRLLGDSARKLPQLDIGNARGQRKTFHAQWKMGGFKLIGG